MATCISGDDSGFQPEILCFQYWIKSELFSASPKFLQLETRFVILVLFLVLTFTLSDTNVTTSTF